MAWLRIDDKFARHPKITRLVRVDRWTWLEVLCYCSEYQTEGWIPSSITQVVPRANIQFLNKALDAGLLDREGDRHRVHDWDDYNPKDPTKAARQARWRAKRDGAVDGKVDASVDDAVDEEGDAPHAGTRARSPAPSPTPSNNPTAAVTTLGGTAAAGLRIRLRKLGWREWQVEAGVTDPERAVAWIERALGEAQTNPGGYAWSGFSSGDDVPLTHNGVRYTGCKWVRGSHSSAWVQDVLGTDKPPADWPHDAPTAEQVQAALAKGKAS